MSTNKKQQDKFCSMCEAELSRFEYDLCDECKNALGVREEDRFPEYNNKPEDGEWR
jgi:predicted amidophosphoribosyltransferase